MNEVVGGWADQVARLRAALRARPADEPLWRAVSHAVMPATTTLSSTLTQAPQYIADGLPTSTTRGETTAHR
ncbi:MAG TPA: hypothetical protein VFT31_07310 [Kribbella sp.]|nr:hypothetical protein [Kribbella sp.]